MNNLLGRAAALGIVGAFSAGLVLTGGVAMASEPTITFGLQAAQAKAVDARPYLSYGVTPGAAIADHIAVVNYSATPLRLAVYARDAQAARDGGITFKAAHEKPTEAGAWLAVAGPGEVTVPPRQASGAPGSVIVPIKLTVPSTATPGDHVAAIIASLVTISKKADGTPIRLDQRVAERAYIRVSGTLLAQLRIEHLHLKFTQPINPLGKSTARVTYTVRNTGNVLLASTQKVVASGLFGSSADSPPLPPLPALLPGASVAVTTTIAHVSPGLRLTAEVILHPAPALQGNVDGRLSPVRSSTAGWDWLAVLIGFLVLASIAIFLYRRYWLYRGPGDAGDASEPSPPRKADKTKSAPAGTR